MKNEVAGKLPPGAAEQLRKSLDQMRQYRANGIIRGVEICGPGPDCEVSAALNGIVYDVDKVPALPMPGCVRSPCGCDKQYWPICADGF